MRIANIFLKCLLQIIALAIFSETVESPVPSLKNTNKKGTTTDKNEPGKGFEIQDTRNLRNKNTFLHFEQMMMEEFDKMETAYHETTKREKRKHGEDIGRLRAKQVYDEELLFQRSEVGLRQEISALRTAVENNGVNITLLKESSLEDFTTQRSESRSDIERSNNNRVKRQKTKKEASMKTTVRPNAPPENVKRVTTIKTTVRPKTPPVNAKKGKAIKTTVRPKTPSVNVCPKLRYCTIHYKSRRSSGKEKKKDVTVNVEPPTSCDDLVKMGYFLDGFYPLRDKKENSGKISINYCEFRITNNAIQNEGNNTKVLADKWKGYVNSNCCSSKTKKYTTPKKEEPEELNDQSEVPKKEEPEELKDQNEEDSSEEENTTPIPKKKKKTKIDPSEPKVVYAIHPETIEILGNATQIGFNYLMSTWQRWHAYKHNAYNNPTLIG